MASPSVTLISQPLPQLSSSRRGRWRLPGSGVGLEAETLALPRGQPCREAPRARRCSRAVVSPNEERVFHRRINNSPGMSGLPASGEGWFWQAGALPAAVVSGHGARSEPACRGRGHRSGGLPVRATVLSPGAGPAFPRGGLSLPPPAGFSQRPRLERAGARREGIPALPGSCRARTAGTEPDGSSELGLGQPGGEKHPRNGVRHPESHGRDTARSWDLPSLCLPSPNRCRGRLRAQRGLVPLGTAPISSIPPSRD